jgi:hypothetical protein
MAADSNAFVVEECSVAKWLGLWKNDDGFQGLLIPFAEENAADLHSVARVSLPLATTVVGKHTDHVKNTNLYHLLAYLLHGAESFLRS